MNNKFTGCSPQEKCGRNEEKSEPHFMVNHDLIASMYRNGDSIQRSPFAVPQIGHAMLRQLQGIPSPNLQMEIRRSIANQQSAANVAYGFTRGTVERRSSTYSTESDNESRPGSLPSPDQVNRRQSGSSPPYSNFGTSSPVNSFAAPISALFNIDEAQPGTSYQGKAPTPTFDYYSRENRSPPYIPSYLQNGNRSPSEQDSTVLKKLEKQKQKRLTKRTKVLNDSGENYSTEMEVLKLFSESGAYYRSPVTSPAQSPPASISTSSAEFDVNRPGPSNQTMSDPTNQRPNKKTASTRQFKVKPRLTFETYMSEPGIMIPRPDGKGGVRQYPCKKDGCQLKFALKHELWRHLREDHLKGKKMFACEESYCSFVTDLAHHMAYHKGKHSGDRPYKCEKCDYEGNAPASLTSHMKTHSIFDLFSCKNCPFSNNFLNMFKTHLRKYNHEPGIIRDKDGNIITDMVIDVYGRKRGPRRKTNDNNKTMSGKKSKETTKDGPITQEYLTQSLLQSQISTIQNFGRMDAQIGTESPLIHQSVFQQNSSMYLPPSSDIPLNLSTLTSMNTTEETVVADQMEMVTQVEEENQIIDLSIKDLNNSKPSDTSRRSSTNKRKGKAVKLVCLQRQYEGSDDEDENNNSVVPTNADNITSNSTSPQRESFYCEFCEVLFNQLVMYSDHMKYHNQKDPSECDICHKRFGSPTDFFFHIGRENHSQYLQ